MNKVLIEIAMGERLDGLLSYEQFIDQVVNAGAEYLSHSHHENACTFYNGETYFPSSSHMKSPLIPHLHWIFPALKKAVQAL